ncbi:unnamed protein product [Adineta ricciae]|uniref:G-protein coupled receptors family 1 profile domain-containing protein n=1 Tax=Adineta ricciae TaxID=249248 RepID=A0A815K806_ADIRI|nr:unnamed protein product [Adineta ricciae]CAF1386332.1 unnamed protein product [Adineta ricciae]
MSNLTDNLPAFLAFQLPRPLRFWYFLVANIASLTCTLFILYFLLFDVTLRRALNNHIIIVLLILGFLYESFNVSWHIRSARFDQPWSMSNTFYLFWTFFDYAVYSIQISLFAWASIERHILIFHDRWISTRIKRLFIHYAPIVVIVVYYFVFYSIIYFGTPCDRSFDGFLSGGVYAPCAFYLQTAGTWDLIVHELIPTLIISFFSIGLLLRVVLQKTRMRQSLQWRKHRKMTVQLLSISVIYMLFNIPWVVFILGLTYGAPLEIVWPALICSKFILYNIVFLFPFVCCLSLPEFRKRAKQMLLFRGRQHRIGLISMSKTRLRAQGATM